MALLTGKAREILKGLVDNKDRVNEYVNTDLKECENLSEILNFLKDRGFIESDMGHNKALIDIIGHWHVKLNYNGLSYFEQEKEYLERQKQSQPNNVYVGGSGNIVQTGNNNTATINNGIDFAELSRLIEAVKTQSVALSADERLEMQESLETIEETLKQAAPKKSLIKTALTTLSAIKNTVEFSVAVANLAQFASTLP